MHKKVIPPPRIEQIAQRSPIAITGPMAPELLGDRSGNTQIPNTGPNTNQIQIQIGHACVFAPANQIQIHSPVFDHRSKYSPHSRAGCARHMGANKRHVFWRGRRAPVVMARATSARALSTMHAPGALYISLTGRPVRA